jgi:hypothetical protein
MTKNVKNRMDALSAEIDQHIEHANSQIPFSEHIAKWWNKLNTKCGKLYTEAGQEVPPSISPRDAIKWLNEQITKLHNFLSSCTLK